MSCLAASASSLVTMPSPLVSARKKKPPASRFPASTASFWGSPALLVIRGRFREEPPTKSLENKGDTSRGRPQFTKSAEEPFLGDQVAIVGVGQLEQQLASIL